MADKTFSFLRQTASKWQFLGAALPLLSSSRHEVDLAYACSALAEVDFSSTSTTILNASYYTNATNIDTLGTCAPTADISDPLCRVQFVVNTSSVSSIKAEAWLPTTWNGRLLALGNGQLGGCIDYDNLEYGSSLGFASVASNNGHDGNSGEAFANNSEVLADYTSRSVHIETIVGKELVAKFYEREPRRCYYMGCSTGGRQGIYAALHYPSDFDGILAGAPAANLNYLLGWGGLITKYLGAPYGEASENFIPSHLWDVVHAEVLRQCDDTDGVVDGIISEPDSCGFRPEELLCEKSNNQGCLSRAQVEALRRVYSPVLGGDGEPLFPRFEPGAENSSHAKPVMFSGQPHKVTDEWMKFVVENDPNYDFNLFSVAEIERMQALDPGKVSTFDGDLSAFRARGGKLISYHGRADGLIPSGNAKALYDLVSRTLGLRPLSLDQFYRLFLVPGLDHCDGGKGAVRFGQSKNSALLGIQQRDKNIAEGGSQQGFKTPEMQPTNILLALVDWVENGHAPGGIVGISDDGQVTREHCRYPLKSRWNGERWTCVNGTDGRYR